jgi:hypothetical protein
MSGANNIGASYTLNYTANLIFQQLFVSEITSISDKPDFTSGHLYVYPPQVHQVDRDTQPQIQSSTGTTQNLQNAANNVTNLNYGTNYQPPVKRGTTRVTRGDPYGPKGRN